MLLQMTVENFRSFRDRTTFSLLVPEGSNAAANTYVEVAGYRVLRAAAIYGANASGKSNFFRALVTAQMLIKERTQVDARLSIEPFRLNAAKAQEPSSFEFELLLEGVRYSYGFTADRESVHSEWLFHDSGKGEELIFERGLSTEPFRFGPLLQETGGRAGFVAEGTRANQLFLSEAVDRNLTQLKPVFDWFAGSLAAVAPDTHVRGLQSGVRDNAAFRAHLTEALARVDTGIVRLSTFAKPFDLSALSLGEQRATFENAVRSGALDDSKVAIIEHDGAFQRLELRTARHDDQGQEVEFPVAAESDGTVRFMHLAPALLPGMFADSVLVVDELDRSLHTLLTRRFVEEFLAQPAENHRQLVYTTHDTNLLTRDLLPPEAVWFAEKDAGGGTALYSLAEFDQDQLDALGPSLEAGYLAGRFGAIPFLANRARLGWVGSEAEE